MISSSHSSGVRLPLSLLQEEQDNNAFFTRSEPPRLFGRMCSHPSTGSPLFPPQYWQVCPNFSIRYSLISSPNRVPCWYSSPSMSGSSISWVSKRTASKEHSVRLIHLPSLRTHEMTLSAALRILGGSQPSSRLLS